MRVDIVSGADVDFDELVELQRRSFVGVPGKAQLDTIQTAGYYRWKYNSPAGLARVAQIRDGHGLIAMNAMFPMPFVRSGVRMRGWQSGDTATAQSARGKGCYQKCLTALMDSLGPQETFIGFPNPTSIGLFRKLGWREFDVLQLFAGLPLGSLQHGVVRVEQFGAAQDALAAKLAASPAVTVERTAAYLNHRYLSPERPVYECFAADDGYIALCVLKVRGRDVALVMDCQALTPRVRNLLLRHAGGWARAKGCVGWIAITNTSGALELIGQGLFPVPKALAPRRLVLVVQRDRPASDGDWRVHLGDWDGL
jgi:hypothetical protein